MSLHRLHEALRRAIARWAAHRRRQGRQSQFSGKRPRALRQFNLSRYRFFIAFPIVALPPTQCRRDKLIA
jgi:hypothetical protein